MVSRKAAKCTNLTLGFGMVPVENYGEKRILGYNFIGSKVIIQATSFSMKLITMKIEAQHPLHHPTAFSYGSGMLSDVENNKPTALPYELAYYQTRMFLSKCELKATFCKIFGIPRDGEIPFKKTVRAS
jgi:hypothetical protein